MVLIMVLHSYVHGCDDIDNVYKMAGNYTTAWNVSLYSLSAIGLNGFMFISGFYGIHFKVKKLFHMLAMLFVYALALTLATGDLTTLSAVRLIFPFSFWWFLGAYIWIMLLSPLIEKGAELVDKRLFTTALIMLWIYTYAYEPVGAEFVNDTICLLTVYITAMYLRLYPDSRIHRLFKVMGIPALMCIVVLPLIIENAGIHSYSIMQRFNSNGNFLLILAAGWMVMKAQSKFYYSSIVNKLTTGTLAIYLITDFDAVRQQLDPWLLPQVLRGYGLLTIIVIAIAILLTDKLRGLLFRYCGIDWCIDKISARVASLFALPE